MSSRTKVRERPAFVEVLAELVSCNTDPLQYKPLNPHLSISNDTQRVFVKLAVPSEEIVSDGKVGKTRALVLTVEGMTAMLRRLSADMQGYIQNK